MAALDSDRVRTALETKLGCKPDETDHHRFVLRDEDGTILASTKISHGPKHSIGPTLIAKMARQIRLGTSANFVAMVKCPLTRDECLTIIRSLSTRI
jgi:hypothetical protein